jgi:putative aminopeptidase FrvX
MVREEGEELTFIKNNAPAGDRSLGSRVVYQPGKRVMRIAHKDTLPSFVVQFTAQGRIHMNL